MSQINVFKASMGGVVAKMSIAHLTRETYSRVVAKFARAMRNAGFTHFSSVEQIEGKHLRAYVTARQKEEAGKKKPSSRSLKNEIACLRQILRNGGRAAVADSPDLTNKKLKIPDGSRIGTKIPMTADELANAQDLAEARARPGLAALLGLCGTLGLRHLEALMADSETLSTWLTELESDKAITVTKGPKGGRSRRVRILHPERAKVAIERALGVAKAQGGFLVTMANGERTVNLEQACDSSRNWMHRNGIIPHSLRYAFAVDQILTYEKRGYSLRAALAATAGDLGHGTGRGRWVRMVYARILKERFLSVSKRKGRAQEGCAISPSESYAATETRSDVA